MGLNTQDSIANKFSSERHPRKKGRKIDAKNKTNFRISYNAGNLNYISSKTLQEKNFYYN